MKNSIYLFLVLCFFYANSADSKTVSQCNKLISIAPYAGVSKTALVNLPLYNQDFLLLKQRYQLLVTYKKEEKCPPSMFELSAMISELSNTYLQNNKHYSTDIGFNQAELDLASASDWATAFVDFAYNVPPPTPAGIIGDSSVYLDRIFLTIGNLSHSPFYVTVGRRYVPFGQYNSYMITGSLAEPLGKTEAGSLLIGYQQPTGSGNYTNIYILKGVKKIFWDSSQQNIAGFTTGYIVNSSFGKMDIGVDYIQSIAVAQALIGTTTDNIPGLDGHASINIKDFTLLAEYTKAISRFNPNALAYYNKGAQPAAINLELGYHFTTLGKKSIFAINVGKTYESASLSLPQKRISLEYNISFYSHAILGFQYLHNFNYATLAANMSSNATLPAKNMIISRLIIYF